MTRLDFRRRRFRMSLSRGDEGFRPVAPYVLSFIGKGTLFLGLCLMLAAPAAASAPGVTSWRTVVVPKEHAALGRVYYVLPGEDAQVVFTSDARLERFVGVSSGVIGYAVAPSDGAPIAGLLKGEFRVGVATLGTGLPLRDARIQSGRWLNAAEHPDIVFTLDHTEEVARAGAFRGAQVWSADLVGALSIRGVNKPVSTRATITVMPENRMTKIRAPGDLLIIRTAFPINLRDYGLNDPSMSVGMVAEDIDLDVFLLLTTTPPEK